jgi:hypothetical protein
MTSDSPIVEEVRQRRHQISERFGHDLQAYYRHLKELEEKYRNRMVSQITVVPPTDRPPTP